MSDDPADEGSDVTRLREDELLAETAAPAADERRRGRPVRARRIADFELQGELGRGGMGVVYRAREISTGRPVALKVLEIAEAGYQLDLAMREARSMAKVSHPNTVFVYRAERTDSGLLLAMELVEGGTLADLIRREGPLPFGRAVDIALQLVRGLEAYDAHGIVHRDVKPSNCFVTRDNVVKIADLGLSRSPESTTRMTQTGRFAGTPLYSSPEQLRGERVERRSDIYSLAATTYELLTGQPPITGSDGVTLVARIMTESPRAPSKIVKEVPKGLDEVLLRALSKKPEHRFPSYAAFAEALAPFQSAQASMTTLGSRALALAVDMFLVASGCAAIEPLLRIGSDARLTSIIHAWIVTWGTAVYFLVLAMVWDRTPGGALLGLRVTNADRGRVGRAAAVLRASLKVVPLVLISAPTTAMPWGSPLGLVLLLLLVSPARATNGYRCLHERASSTRVYHEPGNRLTRLLSRRLGTVLRPRRKRAAQSGSASTHVSPGEAVEQRRFGSFAARRRIAEDEAGTLWSGWDATLDREVWVFEREQKGLALDGSRRELNRPTRLRWIAGAESGGRCWDAFESPGSFKTLFEQSSARRRVPWRRARALLAQLARELDLARGDGTLPESLGLSQIVVRPDDTLLLLDRPIQRVAGSDAERFAADDHGIRNLLRVAIVAFTTGAVRPASQVRSDRRFRALPVMDQHWLRALWGPVDDDEDLLGRIAADGSAEAPSNVEVTRLDRLKQALGSAMLGLIFGSSVLAIAFGATYSWREQRQFAWLDPLMAAALVGLLPPLFALLFRGGLVLSLERVVVERLDGSRAGRIRCVARALPLALAVGCLAAFAVERRLSASLAVLAVVMAGMLYSVLHPARTPGDLLTGTYLRPR